MRIGIIGAGAIGLTLAKILSEKHSVVFICRRKEQAEALDQEAVTSPGNAGEADFFILATKAYDALNALEELRKTYPGKPVLAIQNGLIHFEDPNVIRGVTTYAATRKSDTRAKLVSRGKFFIERKKNSLNMARAFNQAGIETETRNSLGSLLWEKFFINVGINALGAVTGKKNGELVRNPKLKERMKKLVREAVEVSGTEVDSQMVFRRVVDVAIKTGENRNSMLQDLEAGRKTEIEYLNGAVVSLGEIEGVPTPENKRITEEVKELQG